MRARRSAAVGVVAKGMDVHAALGVGIVAGDLPRDSRGGVLVGLLEGHGALDVGVTAEDCDCGGELACRLSINSILNQATPYSGARGMCHAFEQVERMGGGRREMEALDAHPHPHPHPSPICK